MEFSAEFFVFLGVGLLAQLVDGALGMAYGVICASLLLQLGVSPAVSSAAVHAAKVATGAVSGLSHGLLGNVDRGLLLRLSLGGVGGGIAGALLLSYVEVDWLRPVVSAYLLVMGLLILRRAWRDIAPRGAPRGVAGLGVGAGFLDAIGGGGWGPIATTTLVAQNLAPRFAIGTVNAAEFFLSVAVSMVFIGTLGVSHLQVVIGLLLGGVIAAPLAALVAKRLPLRPAMFAVGTLVVLLSSYGLISSLLAA